MDKTITLKYKGLSDIPGGGSAPKTRKDIDKAEAARVHKEKARLLADKVIRQYRDQIEKPSVRPIGTEDLNNNLLRQGYCIPWKPVSCRLAEV